MERRDILKLLAAGVLFPLLGEDAYSSFKDLHAQMQVVGSSRMLTPHQDDLVASIAERIIPQTDTPGALAVQANRFIDLMLTEWLDAADTSRFLEGLSEVDQRTLRRFGKKFTDCTESEQDQILGLLEKESTAPETREDPLRHSADAPFAGSFFRMMKKLTLIAYYTSEAGFREELRASIIPSRHAGCVPLPPEITK